MIQIRNAATTKWLAVTGLTAFTWLMTISVAVAAPPERRPKESPAKGKPIVSRQATWGNFHKLAKGMKLSEAESLLGSSGQEKAAELPADKLAEATAAGATQWREWHGTDGAIVVGCSGSEPDAQILAVAFVPTEESARKGTRFAFALPKSKTTAKPKAGDVAAKSGIKNRSGKKPLSSETNPEKIPEKTAGIRPSDDKVSALNFQRLEVGMTEPQMWEIVGEPNFTKMLFDDDKVPKGQPREYKDGTVYYRRGLLLFMVDLEKGRVKGKFLACSDLVTKEAFEKISLGMTKDEVLKVLGPASHYDRKEQDRLSGEFTGRLSSEWKGYGLGVTLIFADGKIVDKQSYAIPLVGPGPVPIKPAVPKR